MLLRQIDITANPAIVTVGQFLAGVRNNIIPDSAVLIGTIRTFSAEQKTDIFRRVEATAQHIAMASGARVAVKIDSGYIVTRNDEALTARMLPTLERAAGRDNVQLAPLTTGAEDFSYFQDRVPGLFIFLGVSAPDADLNTVPRNHSPLFFADERALPVGVKAMTSLALDWLAQNRN